MTRSPAWFVSCSRPVTTRPRTAWAARSGTWPRRSHQQARLREDPALIPAAVDEILRAFSPAQMLARTVTREVEMCGRTLRRGDKVGLFWAAANRDPDVFADPERIDLTRSSKPTRRVRVRDPPLPGRAPGTNRDLHRGGGDPRPHDPIRAGRAGPRDRMAAHRPPLGAGPVPVRLSLPIASPSCHDRRARRRSATP